MLHNVKVTCCIDFDISSSPLVPKISSVQCTIYTVGDLLQIRCFSFCVVQASSRRRHFDHFFCDDVAVVGVVGVTKARPSGVAGQLGAGNCHNTSEKLHTWILYFKEVLLTWHFGFLLFLGSSFKEVLGQLGAGNCHNTSEKLHTGAFIL